MNHYKIKPLKVFIAIVFSHRLTIPSGRPPWLENIKTTERLVRDTWKRNEALQNAMLDEFIKDTLHAEIVGIVSSTLTVRCLTIFCI